MVHSAEEWARRIRRIVLDEASLQARRPEIERERQVAVADLLEDNRFFPREDGLETPLFDGPFDVQISVTEDSKLNFDISSDTQPDGMRVALPVRQLRTIIKDYFMICDSYTNAIQSGNHVQVEAIDMGRRGVHNEGSELLKELLYPRVWLNFETARRLFTLVCVLHMR
ncbi:UPF0262 family protein [bacterium]|nr:UPF0262 family protein [bacterium]